VAPTTLWVSVRTGYDYGYHYFQISQSFENSDVHVRGYDIDAGRELHTQEGQFCTTMYAI
jgi:hypothetical protein